MANTQSDKVELHGTEAISKLKEITESIGTCMFTTDVKNDRPQSDPMTLQGADEDGCLWFISSSESDRNQKIWEYKTIQLYFADSKSLKFVYIIGSAEISRDKKMIDKYWNNFSSAWFDGKDDPRVTLLKVTPEEVKFWESKDSNIITFLKISAAAITGNLKNDGGIEGTLNI